ncbi:hypothetical protein C8J34_1086 [Rhizobium sp. PP-F2F-G36]|nr:hypothetical protein C8J34_1086 [Rhizobium sp. PP-F2F-G36]
MRDIFLIDTNIVSHMGYAKPKPGLLPWLLEIGTPHLAICYPVIAELLRGAHLLMPYNPAKAREILAWVGRIRSTDFAILPMDFEAADMYARMTTTPCLKNMWTSDGKSKRTRLGHDLMIAAVAIAHKTPILTENVRDFLLIDRIFPLPGLYHPYESTWYVEPTYQMQLPAFDTSRPDPWAGSLPTM